MNALEMARTAYTSPAAPIRTERGNEYEAIARVTRELRTAIPAQSRDYKGFVTALYRNRQLWTVLAANVADKENALPADLRARLFYLAEFTLFHTSEILARREDAEVLVEINTAIMQGLRAGEQKSGGPAL